VYGECGVRNLVYYGGAPALAPLPAQKGPVQCLRWGPEDFPHLSNFLRGWGGFRVALRRRRSRGHAQPPKKGDSDMKADFVKVKKVSGAVRAHRGVARIAAGRVTGLTAREVEVRIFENLEVIAEDPEAVFWELFPIFARRPD